MGSNKEYIGDGAYIQQGEYNEQVILTTENGIEVINIIYLGLDHVKAIFNYIKRHYEDGI